MKQSLMILLLVFSYKAYSQHKILDFSLPNYTILIDAEEYKDSTYSGEASLYIYDTINTLVNTIHIDNFHHNVGDFKKQQTVNCLVDYNNDGINDITILTKFDNQIDNREYEVYLFDSNKNKFIKNETATAFKNENKGKIIVSHRTKNSISVYDVNDEDFRQISEYIFVNNEIRKTQTKTEDFKTDKKYVIVTIQTYNTKDNTKLERRYLKENYLLNE